MNNKLNPEQTMIAPRKSPIPFRRCAVFSVVLSSSLIIGHGAIASNNANSGPLSSQFAAKNASLGEISDSPSISAHANQIRNNFIRNIRTAIAAKWRDKQLHDYINTLSPPPEYEIVNKHYRSDTGNSFKPFIGHATLYDSNVLRIADASTDITNLAGRAKDDLIKQIRAGIAARWSFQRQVLLIKAMISQNWYATYQELDFLGRDILAQWNWQVGNRLNGELGYKNIVQRGSFGQLNNLVNNLENRSQYFVNGEYQFIPSWFLRGGFKRTETNYSDRSLQNNNQLENAGEIGIKYRSPTNTQLGLRYTQTNGSFSKRQTDQLNQANNSYIRRDYDFYWDWNYSAKTRIDGSIGYTEQTYPDFSARNFSAPTAKANLHWEATGKTSFLFSAWREINYVNSLSANFVLSQGLGFTPRWLATPKIDLTAPLSYETLDYLGNPGIFQGDATGIHDKVLKTGINVDYSPIEQAKITLGWHFEKRSSTILPRNYDANAVGLDLQLGF